MRALFASITLSILLVLPVSNIHAETFEYKPLEPSFFRVGADATVNASSFFEILYTTALWAAVVLAVFMIVVAGVEYTAGGISESAKSDAKHRIQNALIGLFLALFAYLFLKTINPELVKTTLDTPQGTVTRSGGGTSGGGTPGTGTPGGAQTSGDYRFVGNFGSSYVMPGSQIFETRESCESSAQSAGATRLSSGTYCSDKLASWYEIDKIVRGNLSEKHIDVNNSNSCVSQSSGDSRNYPGSGCTDVAGLPSMTINALGRLKNACNCLVEITGGTEPGHATHGRGANIVDLDVAITNFLRTDGRVLSGTWNGNNPSICMQVSYGGGTYRYEPAGRSPCSGNSSAPHWHAIFQ